MPSSSSPLRHRAAWLAASASSAFALACHHNGPSSSPSSRLKPVAGLCGQRTAVAVDRGRASRSASQGALVIHLSPADSGRYPPNGPVRLTAATASSRTAVAETRVLQVGASGETRTGPLPAGRYLVEVAGAGYQPRRFTVTVRRGATDTLRFRLASACVRRASR